MKEQILKLRKEGKTYSQIKEIVGCSKSTISYHCGNKDISKSWKKFKYNKEILILAVDKAISFAGILKELNLPINGGKYLTLKKKLIDFNIPHDHLLGQAWAKGLSELNSFSEKEFYKKVLKLNGTGWSSHKIKLKLYKFKLKTPICEKCNLTDWLGKSISLHLDHINGNNKDNRIENLRILCPNCHSQTETYAGKNIGSYGGK